MDESHRTLRIEPRWPVVLAIISAVLLLALLPGRLRFLPGWFPYLLGIVLVAPVAAVGLTAGSGRWLRMERAATLLFVLVTGASALAGLAKLIGAVVGKSGEVSGMQLLASSVAVWVSNVLAFSLLYWHIDRGGPEERVHGAGVRPDWLFPQTGAVDDAPPGWRPTYVDYLFLAYSTATAFSTTEVAPLTSRAKLLMMLESTISLLTMVVVASRAINILGS